MRISWFVIFIGLALVFTLGYNSASAVESEHLHDNVISVTGSASSLVEPNLVAINFGVETEKKSARDALGANSAIMDSVIDSIMSVGIAKDEISTSQFTIYAVYEDYQEDEQWKRRLVGYKASNTINVETSKLDSVADIIDRAVNSGVNRVDSVYFKLSPQVTLAINDDLIAKAISNAKSKAENALVPLAYEIIGVQSIDLTQPEMPYRAPVYGYADVQASAFKSAPPIFSSDQEITTHAHIVFIIDAKQ